MSRGGEGRALWPQGYCFFFGPKITRERLGEGGGGGRREVFQGLFPSQGHELSSWKFNLNVGDFYDPVQLYIQQSRGIITLQGSNTITFNDQNCILGFSSVLAQDSSFT